MIEQICHTSLVAATNTPAARRCICVMQEKRGEDALIKRALAEIKKGTKGGCLFVLIAYKGATKCGCIEAEQHFAPFFKQWHAGVTMHGNFWVSKIT